MGRASVQKHCIEVFIHGIYKTHKWGHLVIKIKEKEVEHVLKHKIIPMVPMQMHVRGLRVIQIFTMWALLGPFKG